MEMYNVTDIIKEGLRQNKIDVPHRYYVKTSDPVIKTTRESTIDLLEDSRNLNEESNAILKIQLLILGASLLVQFLIIGVILGGHL